MTRAPSLSLSLPESGDTMTNVNAMGISAIPAAVAPRPRALCHVSGNRKITPYMPKVMAVVATEAALNGFDANNSSGTSAAFPTALSVRMKRAMRAMAARHARSADQTLVCASMAAKASRAEPDGTEGLAAQVEAAPAWIR